MTIIVLGGAGFIGSAVADELVAKRKRVVIVDNLSTGRLSNLSGAISTGRASFIYADIEADGHAAAASVERIAPPPDRRLVAAGISLSAAQQLARLLHSPLACAVTSSPDDLGEWPAAGDGTAVFDSRGAFGPRMPLDGTTVQRAFSAFRSDAAAEVRVPADLPLQLVFSLDLASLVVSVALDGTGDGLRNEDYLFEITAGQLGHLIEAIRTGARPNFVLDHYPAQLRAAITKTYHWLRSSQDRELVPTR